MQESRLCCVHVVHQADPHADKRAAATAVRAEVKGSRCAADTGGWRALLKEFSDGGWRGKFENVPLVL